MVDYSLNDGQLLCVFGERLDTAACLSLEKGLLDKVKEVKSQVVFDLGKVNYIASSFLRLCFQTAKECGEVNLSLINVNPEIKRVLKVAGVDKRVKVD